jgi:hypothetical protein
MRKLLEDPIPKLSVRYAKNKHSVPDITDSTVSDTFVRTLLQLLKAHDLSGGSIKGEIVEHVSLENLPSHEAEKLLHLLHRSKVLSDGKEMVRKKQLTHKYNSATKRLELILGTINAGGDNPKIKQEGLKLARHLRNVKRITTAEYKDIIARLENPPIMPFL